VARHLFTVVFTSPEPALTGANGAHRIWASGSFVLNQRTCERATLVHEPSVSPGLDHLGICLVAASTAVAALEALPPQLDATTAAEMNEIVTGVVGLAAGVVALSARTKSSASVGPARVCRRRCPEPPGLPR
jgi:hypothetical protein